MKYPEYCCSILVKDQSQFLLQLRPHWSKHAPNKLVCFGGRREPDEEPDFCIARELREELKWTPSELKMVLELWTDDHLCAWFYFAEFDVELSAIQTEVGFEATLVATDALSKYPLSDWHRVVLDAYLRGEEVVRI